MTTFNVMYEPARAGGGLAARWPLVVDLLRDADADLLAFQEVQSGRLEPLRRALPGYAFAVSAPSGRHPGPSRFVIALAAGALVILGLAVFALRRFGRIAPFAPSRS